MTSGLGRRIAFTLGALVVYRIGESTAAHLDRVWSRVAMVGTAYLAVVFLIPGIVISATRVP